MAIPDYLMPCQQSERYYGILKLSKNRWILEGEPCVIEMAKRLFPGCNVTGLSGRVEFSNTKRINGDLNWLMLRYPLEIENYQEWIDALSEAQEHAVKRADIYNSPQRSQPPYTFKGELLPFQQEGLSFLNLNRRTLLADEMGLGKTVQALAFITASGEYPVLIIVPPYLTKHWIRKIDEFITLPGLELEKPLFDENISQVHEIKGLKPYQLPDANIYLIHYLLLRGWKKVLPDYGFKTVIFDEIQELRHGQTEKYSAASLIAGSAQNAIGLSGTPIYNRGGEMWHIINILEFHAMGSYDSFTREWCRGYGSDVVKDPVLLGDYLRREGLMLRRRKDDVLDDLLPKRRVVEMVDYDTGVYGNLIREAAGKAMQYDSIQDALEKGRAMRDIVRSARQATGISKAPYVAAFVKALLDAGEKVLLFAYHHKAFEIYIEALKEYNPMRITGHETAKEKDTAIQIFQQEESQVVILSLRSTAGLDGLQSASCVVFGELDWSPAVHSQAEDRAHRMGQKDSVLCYYLVCNGGSDAEMQEALGLKVSQFVGIMGDHAETEQDKELAQVVATAHMRKIIEKLKSRYSSQDNSLNAAVNQ